MEANAIFTSLGIDPEKLPPGQVRLASREELRQFSSRELQLWADNPFNDQVLAYKIESEFDPVAGFSFRNLHFGPNKAHFFLEKKADQGPYFHNLHYSLPKIWETGRVCVVEGPKDARVVSQLGVPTVACLTAAPKRTQLRVLARYTDYIIWIQDNDPDQQRMQDIRDQVVKQCESEGLRVHRYRLRSKDPAQQFLDDPKVLYQFAHFFHHSL